MPPSRREATVAPSARLDSFLPSGPRMRPWCTYSGGVVPRASCSRRWRRSLWRFGPSSHSTLSQRRSSRIACSPPGTFRAGSVSSIRSSIQSPKRRFATALSAFPTWSDPVGLGSNGPARQRPMKLAPPAVEMPLLPCFARRGRDLPWRRSRDPYAILVSEVMLQQTQVSRVVPRYRDWLERWPTAAALAAASAADVIRAWQGLGYHRRAVDPHRAAKRIAAGGWPADLTELPGVGSYTALAIRRFALGEPVLPQDTNVRRVLERTEANFGPESAQALMDLGATVCLARIPRCGECPLAGDCPSRGRRYEPLRKQSRFEGSFRQRRARALRLVAERPRALAALDHEAVASLRDDGLVVCVGKQVRLP